MVAGTFAPSRAKAGRRQRLRPNGLRDINVLDNTDVRCRWKRLLSFARMKSPTSEWTCDKCDSINQPEARSCWDCETERPLTPDLISAYETYVTNSTIRDLLLLHVGYIVQVNLDDPSKASAALLAEVHGDHFTLQRVGHPHKHHCPLVYLLGAVELPPSDSGRGTLLLEIHRQVFTKGFFGVGFSMP